MGRTKLVEGGACPSIRTGHVGIETEMLRVVAFMSLAFGGESELEE